MAVSIYLKTQAVLFLSAVALARQFGVSASGNGDAANRAR